MPGNRKALAQILLLGVVLVWGATFVLVKTALADASPLLFNCLRMTLATLALAIVNRKKLTGITRAQLRAGALAGVFLAAGYELQTLGLARTSAAKSAFITGLVVVFVPGLMLFPRFRPPGTSRPGWNAAAGAMSAFAGLLLLTTPSGTEWRHLFASIGLGDLLTLGCAAAFAAHLLSLARASTILTAGTLATLQVGTAAILMLFLVPLEPMHFHATMRLALTLAVTSLLATAAAFTIQSFAQQVLRPANTAVLLTLEPVFAWLTSLLLLGVGLSHRGLLGAALILGGIALTELTSDANTVELPA